MERGPAEVERPRARDSAALIHLATKVGLVRTVQVGEPILVGDFGQREIMPVHHAVKFVTQVNQTLRVCGLEGGDDLKEAFYQTQMTLARRAVAVALRKTDRKSTRLNSSHQLISY